MEGCLKCNEISSCNLCDIHNLYTLSNNKICLKKLEKLNKNEFKIATSHSVY